MFHCARVRDDLHITVNFKKALGAAAGTVVFLVFSVWIFWAVAFKGELSRMKKEIYLAVSQSMGEVIRDAFNQNHSSLLKLESCQSELKQASAINKDLSKVISGKMPSGVEEGVSKKGKR